MIQCPRCASLEVSEERFIPPPSGELKGWTRILFWPFRMPGMAITTALAVLLALGSMTLLSEAFRRSHPDSDFEPGMVACAATALLGLYAVGMARLPGLLVSKVLPALSPEGKGLSRIPRVYHRTCSHCGYLWTWDPVQPSLSSAPPVSMATAFADQHKSEPDHEKPKTATAIPFHCPDCGHTSSYDPWVGPAHCPVCGYSPGLGKFMRRAMKRLRLDASQPYLQDFLGHWEGKPSGDSPFDLSTEEKTVESFNAYQRALGEDIHPSPGHYYASGYFRKHFPTRREILAFLNAYRLIKNGENNRARDELIGLTRRSPDFIEPWLWLAVVADDPIERDHYLDRAYSIEPSHPLVVDIRSIVRGKVSISTNRGDPGSGTRLEAQHCPRCGGILHYEAGTSEVDCSHCGHRVILQPMFHPDRTSHPVSAMRLQRKLRSQSWKDLDRILACQACGARLTMTERLAKVCAFCGSPNVIIEDHKIALEQPDGFVPFQIDKQNAKKTIQRHRPSMLWDFKGWRAFRHLRVEHLVGVYIPFWLFDGIIDPVWAWMRHDGTYTKTSGPGSHYTVEDLMFPGTDRPAPSQLDEVSDFNLSSMVEYEPQLLADWPAMLYNLDVEIVVEDAYDVMITLAQEALGPPILTGLDVPADTRAVRTLQVANTTYQLILLPLWVGSMTCRDAIALALVNGQTGDSVFRMVYRS